MLINIDNKNYLKTAFLALLTVFISGCGLWQNFTVYFNRYFNAADIFEQAEEEIEKDKTEIFEFKEKKIPSSANQNLTKVIEKCSKILQFDRESAYFDNALYMIGKSFYYQGEYAKAIRKFNELASVEDTDLSLINKYWIGKTQLQLRNFEEGDKILQAATKQAIEENENEIAHDAYVARISYFIDRENYTTSIELCNELLNISDDDELNAEVSFQLGKLYIKLNQVENAAEAFARVEQYSPTFETEFASNFENAKLQKQLGNIDESYSLFQNLKSQDKYKDNFDKIDLEIAQIHFEKGEYETALTIYTEVDTAFKNTASSGIAKYKIAEIWETYYRNYDSAKFYYDQLQSSTAEADLKKEAKRKSNVFVQYNNINSSLKKYFKQQLYKSDPEAFYRDSLEYEDLLKRDTTQLADSLDNLNNNVDGEPEPGNVGISNKGAGGRIIDDPKLGNTPGNQKQSLVEKLGIIKPERLNISDDSLNSIISKNLFDLGNVFLGDLEVPDSAYFYYSQITDNYPNISFKPKFLFALGSYYSTIGDNKKADSLYNIVYTNYSSDETANEAARRLGKTEIGKTLDPAELAYISAEEIYYASNYTAAIDSFYNIYFIHPNSYLAPKALYTAGWIYENELNMPDSAVKAYDTLSAKYKNTDYTRAVRNKLFTYNNEKKRIQDSIAQVQKAIEDSIAAANTPLISDSLSADTLNAPISLPVDSTNSSSSLLPDSISNKNADIPKEFQKVSAPKPKKLPDNAKSKADTSKLRKP
jgi:tetratricopeptide (TPR) repeat protein